MGFVFEPVGVVCDCCGLDSDPVDWNGTSLDPARESLRNDGWIVAFGDKFTCLECQEREEDDAIMPGGFA